MPSLDWIGKGAVIEHHKRVPLRLLSCDETMGAGEPDSGNLLVQGDNLEALRALLPYYAGQVKCVYIDPPYNTGNEGWIYNDSVSSPEITKWLGQAVGRESEDLSRHDKWLCMMLPRLNLLKRMLRPDGVIFVSIDENEVGVLRMLMDEVFGVPNRVGTIVWKNATDNNPTRIVPEHEYVLCYARDNQQCARVWRSSALDAKTKLIEVGDEIIAQFDDADDRQRAYTKWLRENKPTIWPFQDYKFIDEHGIYTGMRSVHNPGKEGYRYDVLHPRTGKPCKQPLMGYRFPEATMKTLLDDGRILFGKDENKLIELKVYARDYRSKLSSVFELDGRRGTNEVKSIFPESRRPFDFPKPTGLVEELLAFTTSDDDLVMDSFAGSATTGHAVLKLNAADSGRRRFVLVELDSKIAESITAERLRRVVEGRGDGGGRQGKSLDALGSGFRYCRLGAPIIDQQGAVHDEVSYDALARFVFFVETGSPLAAENPLDSPLIGVFGDAAVYLLFNGVLGDRRPRGGNVLTHAVAQAIPEHPAGDGRRIVYGEACRLGKRALDEYGITFKQLPFDLRVN